MKSKIKDLDLFGKRAEQKKLFEAWCQKKGYFAHTKYFEAWLEALGIGYE